MFTSTFVLKCGAHEDCVVLAWMGAGNNRPPREIDLGVGHALHPPR